MKKITLTKSPDENTEFTNYPIFNYLKVLKLVFGNTIIFINL